jgi:hypothetical protein
VYLGSLTGLGVGDGFGVDVGAFVGTDVSVGSGVGVAVGFGVAVGATVGLGVAVGAAVGALVGTGVGVAVACVCARFGLLLFTGTVFEGSELRTVCLVWFVDSATLMIVVASVTSVLPSELLSDASKKEEVGVVSSLEGSVILQVSSLLGCLKERSSDVLHELLQLVIPIAMA